MLLDMDSKSELSHEEQGWVEELMEVLYEADDLLDKVITTAKMKELNKVDEFFKKVVHEVSLFFSCVNCILVRYNTSQEVKSIELKLDAIARDHERYKFNAGPQSRNCEFKVDHQATFIPGSDTDSVLDKNIIGREADLKVIIDMLSDPNVEENVGFVVIVGTGGLGKTTLAQLVYNDKDGTNVFNKKLWVCVSDKDGKGLNVKNILKKIIELSTGKPSDLSTMQSLQIKLKKELESNTHLLILDDVWTENPNEWSELKKYLTIGGRGSRIVITTRSEKTAEVILGKDVHSKKHMLKGLSHENSWRLFLLTAFDQKSDQAKDPELINLGQKIVKKCSNFPLAIKVLGTLLYGQTHRWKSFEKNRLPQIETTKNPIMSILKLSYDNLEPSVKSCFRYCALFPKDFEMDKRSLINLWYAQGYIGDSEDDFLILLKRCFFQYVKKNECGDVISVKMHDLMHDLAQEVAGDEIIVANSLPNILCRKNRHLFLDGREIREYTWDGNTMIHLNIVKTLVSSWHWLRSLCLYVPESEILSESIGELLHLRYIDLSQNKKLKTLPNSIAKLYNLRCLVMRGCRSFNEWPKDFCKLVNLRLLDIRDCSALTCMPLGIDQLSNLRDLTNFKVGGVSLIDEQPVGQLKDLKSLVNLRGEIHIRIYGNLASEKENIWEDYYLKHAKNLKVVSIWIPAEANVTNQEALIAKLQPSEYLLEFRLNGYNGIDIPRWGRAYDDWNRILPNLIKIELVDCKRLNGIPLLSNLKLLKFLSLHGLSNFQFMEISGSSGFKDIPFFPSLQYLCIWDLKMLKGWRGGVGEGDISSCMPHWQPPFPRLSSLLVLGCPELTSFPPCPSLEYLCVRRSNNLLRMSPGEGHGNLDIKNCPSLKSLKIDWCTGLSGALGALEHLTALESLSVGVTDAEVDLNDMPWSSLRQNLRFLELKNFRTLPYEMKHLTALQNLSIDSCYSFKGLPEWISCLSSLQSLRIDACSDLDSLGTIQNITSLQKLDIVDCWDLGEACQKPSGKEWPKIQHIPHINIPRPLFELAGEC